jgi:hypothetical protein
MNRTTAQATTEQMLRFCDQLNGAVEAISRGCGEPAAAAYDLRVSRLIGDSVARVLVPIWLAHPEVAPREPETQERHDSSTFRVPLGAARAALASIDGATRNLEEARSMLAQELPPGQERQALDAALRKLLVHLDETRGLLQSDIENAPN